MVRATMGCSVLWVLVFCPYVFLQVGSAQNSSCDVTVRAKQTAYNITKMPDVSHLERCDYTWANSSNDVFATNKGELPELVMRNSIAILVISQCMNHTILTLDCVSQGLYTFHCFCDCSERATHQEDKGPPTKTSNPWIYVIVVIFLILVLMVLCFLVYKYRDYISRICNRNYTAGRRTGPTNV